MKLATNIRTNKKYAIKLMPIGKDNRANVKELVDNEVNVLAKLKHPNILKIIEYSTYA